jgi:DAK2 domain
MIDALEPFTRTFGVAAARGTTLLEAWKEALSAAARGANSTSEMVSKKGRALQLGERRTALGLAVFLMKFHEYM